MNAARHAVARRVSGRFTTRAAILAVVVGALLVAAVFPLRTYLSERSQIRELTQQAATLEHENARLQAKIRKLHDPDEIERLARECLGMVKAGEVPFAIAPKHSTGPARPARC